MFHSFDSHGTVFSLPILQFSISLQTVPTYRAGVHMDFTFTIAKQDAFENKCYMICLLHLLILDAIGKLIVEIVLLQLIIIKLLKRHHKLLLPFLKKMESII